MRKNKSGSVLLEWVLAATLFALAIQLQIQSLRYWHKQVSALDAARIPYEGLLPFSQL